MSTLEAIDPLDRPVNGAKAMAKVLNLLHKKGRRKGKPNARPGLLLVGGGVVDADKLGKAALVLDTATTAENPTSRSSIHITQTGAAEAMRAGLDC